jgi:hypothetical protein
MDRNQAGFALPPRLANAQGETRRVGFELEFSGISLDQTVAAVSSALGGEVISATRAESQLKVADLGSFNIELDWAYLKRKAGEVNGEDGEWLEHLSNAAALLVPVEVVCPPIPITQLERLNPLIQALREAGAQGTEESLIAAYGVHINAEIPGLDAATLFDYIRAFALLQWWLVDLHEVDIARRISPYIDLYPDSYLARLLARAQASMEEIFEDYLDFNDTRNRALDLLPILAQADEARVRARVDDPKIKARPAFHYRLPNCHIERPDWSLATPWRLWCVVEQLAARRDALDELAAAFRAADRPIIGVSRSDWIDYIDQWLKDHELA